MPIYPLAGVGGVSHLANSLAPIIYYILRLVHWQVESMIGQYIFHKVESVTKHSEWCIHSSHILIGRIVHLAF